MARLTFEVPDTSAERMAAAVCARFGFDPESGKTPVEFTTEIVFNWLRDVTLSYEGDIAAEEARTAVLENPYDPLTGHLRAS